jgi:hypothetical protein
MSTTANGNIERRVEQQLSFFEGLCPIYLIFSELKSQSGPVERFVKELVKLTSVNSKIDRWLTMISALTRVGKIFIFL